MIGDARVRFCGQCNLHVYNLSEMPADEALALVAETEGRLCARFYRRADGTVLTKDCPVGLHAVRVRASRVAGAVLSAIVSLFSTAPTRAAAGRYLQGDARAPISIKRTVRPDAQDATASLTGTIYDTNKAVIVNAKVTVFNHTTKQKRTTASNDEGVFRLENLAAGEYTLTFESSGFRPFKIRTFLDAKETAQVDVTLLVAEMGGPILIK